MKLLTVAGTVLLASVALGASQVHRYVVSPGQALPPPQQRPLVLVPVSGTWTADYENAQQILTINGAAPAKAPDAEAAKSLFGESGGELVTALAAPGAYPLAVARDIKAFTGGRLSVQFKLIDGATDQTAGLLFGLKANGSYTYARYNTKDGNVAIWKFENGARTVLKHGELHEQLPKGVWHTLEVTVDGRTVSATANKRFNVSHTLDAAVDGRVGVWTKTDSVTSFRGFTGGHQHTIQK
jgi:hypothetical protein